MERLIIGRHTQHEKMHNKQRAEKEALFIEALEQVGKVIEVADQELFKDSFATYLKTEFRKQHPALFPSELVSTEKGLELVNFNLNRLYDLERKYKAIEVPTEYDYNYYLTKPESIEYYQRLQSVCEAVNVTRSTDRPIEVGILLQSFGGSLAYNWDTQQIEPNLSFFLANHI